MTTPDENDKDGKKAGPGGTILTLAVVAVMSAVAAGGGWMLGSRIAPEPAEARAAETVSGRAAPTRLESGHLVALDPITTNLGYPSDNWVRLEVSLSFEAEPDAELAGIIHQDILAYLRTVSLQQIDGARGFQHLREDLTERAALRSEGKVSGLLFRTFVIE